jgi:hypothetical protein
MARFVQYSRNLRGIISRAHNIGVRFVAVQRNPDGASVIVSFRDYSGCETQFADFSVALDWFRSRAKRWGMVERINTPTHHSFHLINP